MIPRKDPAYLDWIRGLSCAECSRSPAEPHHPKGDLNLSGVGLRAPDVLAFPVCRDCHRQLQEYRDGWRLMQRGCMIKTLIRALDAGVITREEGDRNA